MKSSIKGFEEKGRFELLIVPILNAFDKETLYSFIVTKMIS